MRVLTLNPGSPSMKVSLVADGTAVGWTAWDLADPGAVVQSIRRWSDVDAIAVRFVHGGEQKAPHELLASLEQLTALAPNHQPLSREVRRTSRSSPASTPPSTSRCPSPDDPVRCRFQRGGQVTKVPRQVDERRYPGRMAEP